MANGEIASVTNNRACDMFPLIDGDEFEALKRDIAAGRLKIGARLIGERIRWECAIQTTDVEFKINDHYWPFYARLFMTEHPRHAGIFETRGHDALPGVSRRAK